MNFDNQIPEWKNTGTEPSTDLKTNGFPAGLKPPAGIFNWFWSKVTKAINELQTKLSGHANNKENPHGVTATQLGLDKVNNTSDSEKSVKFASEAGVGRKVQYPITVRFNGGATEGTNLWTYDGSTSRSINITPDKIEAAKKEHDHTLDDVSETTERRLNHIVNATSADGALYTATCEGITELYNGLEITIIPNTTSTKAAVQFDLNGWGAKNVRMKLSFNSANAGTLAKYSSWIGADAPITLRYSTKFNMWLSDLQMQSAQSLYGTVPIDGGGTGGTTAEEARENLGVAPAVEDTTYAGCYYRMNGEEKEWINPPMVEGVEYRTTERYEGKPVYVVKNILSETNKEVDIEGAKLFVDVRGYKISDEHCTLHPAPWYINDTLVIVWADGLYFSQGLANAPRVGIKTDLSANVNYWDSLGSVLTIVKYIKS